MKGNYDQTAGISFRAFYKLGTEPLPMGLEKLIAALKISSFRIKAPRELYDWLISLAFRYQGATEALSLVDCKIESLAFG